MINKIKKAVATVTALAGSTSSVLAVETDIGSPISGEITSVGDIAGIAFNAIIGIAGVLALILLAIGGIQYMTSGGDKMAVEQARGRITAAVVGLLVVFGAWLIITVLGNLLGAGNVLTPGF